MIRTKFLDKGNYKKEWKLMSRFSLTFRQELFKDTHLKTFVVFLIGVVIIGTPFLALLAALVVKAFVTHASMEAVRGAVLAARMTLSADGFASHALEVSRFLVNDPF
jgi:hypothetical protein